jgi:DNA invertase Pin-like site-specific DNA recombinase
MNEAKARTLVGYARVSTQEQSLDLQIDALNSLGVVKVFTETASGAKSDRPQLAAALNYMRENDVLVVYRLDRLGRSLADLVRIVGELEARGVGFRSVHENIDTTSSTGRLVFHVFAALAEFERDLIIDRTRAGLAAARERGSKPGRKPSLTADQIEVARRLCSEGKSVKEVAGLFGVSRPTIYRALERMESAPRGEVGGGP